MEIIDLSARQILDSRGNPTLEVEVTLIDGSKGSFQVPSGASTGIHEAHELRDKDDSKYKGKSVIKAVENVHKLKKDLLFNSFNQNNLDKELCRLDGTENKTLLGANTLLGISCAFARASAKFHNLPLSEYLYRVYSGKPMKSKKLQEISSPHLFANIINGGLHAGNGLKIQEFMIVPDLRVFEDNVRAISEVYANLKEIISQDYSKDQTAVGDEGGFAPNISTPKEALNLLNKAVEASGYSGKVFYAIDAAASDFYDPEKKLYEVEKGKNLSYKELSDYYNDLIKTYPLISIEDPFSEDDFKAFEYFQKKVKALEFVNPLTKKKEILVVGDDLLVTNPNRIALAMNQKLCNSLLLKINQIGTLSEALDAHRLSEKARWHTIVSHRSGETTDDFIADLSIALNSSIKLGAPCRGERVAKYNRLLKILQ